ncbi:MAG: PEP-CTERM sorting domain-containing protein [Phycisphaerales bacterium]|nr:MAG: PEP-CTERM sorting domain-containing protein [Phycisphaerales bacterium]
MVRGFIITAAVVVGISSVGVRPTHAKLVTIAVTGEVTSVWDDFDRLEGKINVGDMITGVYVYDSSTPDSFPEDPVHGRYEYYAPPCGIMLTVGGFVFMTDPDNVRFVVIIKDDFPDPRETSYDGYSVASYNNLPLSNGAEVGDISLGAKGSTDIFTTDALPATAPDLDAGWHEGGMGIRIYGGSRGGSSVGAFSIGGYVTSATVIPEPGTFILFALGSLALLKTRS